MMNTLFSLARFPKVVNPRLKIARASAFLFPRQIYTSTLARSSNPLVIPPTPEQFQGINSTEVRAFRFGAFRSFPRQL